MNNDGFGQGGDTMNSMRQGGDDLQHALQTRLKKEASHIGNGSTGMDVHEALRQEMDRHIGSKAMRLSDLKNHYER